MTLLTSTIFLDVELTNGDVVSIGFQGEAYRITSAEGTTECFPCARTDKERVAQSALLSALTELTQIRIENVRIFNEFSAFRKRTIYGGSGEDNT